MMCCRSRSIRRALSLCVLVFVGTLAGCEESPPPPLNLPLPGAGAGMMSTPFITPPITSPQYFTVTECRLDASETVVGIVINNTALAFVKQAMAGMTTHVVNDIVDGQPFSISYCDRTDYFRVLDGAQQGQQCDVQTGGFKDGEMALRVDGKFYSQSSKDIPLKDRKFEVTTLGEWTEKHPDTRIYQGSVAPKNVPAEKTGSDSTSPDPDEVKSNDAAPTDSKSEDPNPETP